MAPISRRTSKNKKKNICRLLPSWTNQNQLKRYWGPLVICNLSQDVYPHMEWDRQGKTFSISILDKSKFLKSSELGDSPQGTDNEVNATTDGKSVTEDDLLQMATMSTSSMKKFLDEEAERYLASNAPEIRRQRKIKKLLAKRFFPRTCCEKQNNICYIQGISKFKRKIPAFKQRFNWRPWRSERFEGIPT